MNEQRRLLLFMVLSLASWFALQFLLEATGLMPRPKPDAPAEIAKPAPPEPLDEEALAQVNAFADDPDGPNAFANPFAAAAAPVIAQAEASKVPLVDPAQLVIGSTDPTGDPANAYHLRLDLTQRGAGVARVLLAAHEAEFERRGQPTKPLAIVDIDRVMLPNAERPGVGIDIGRPPLGIDIILQGKGDAKEDIRSLGEADWEVVIDDKGRVVRPLPADPETKLLEGQAVVFQTEVADIGLKVTKTIEIRKGRDAAQLSLRFESARPLKFAYRLQGPYGVPVEGQWYTSVFRDVFFGKLNGGNTEIETKPANDVVDRELQGDPIRATSLPLKYAGVENQYFAVFLEPNPLPKTPQERWDEKTVAITVDPAKEKHKSDVSIVIDTRQFQIVPGTSLVHGYNFYAGPKSADALAAYDATELSSYRKGWQIPLIGDVATWLARVAIAPLLHQIYGATRTVAGLFGGKRGNYGIAIILLTFAVRMLMFPLSRKQAQSAKRMQDLQPKLLELREKYKDDKEKIGRETLELYRQNGVNPLGGCGLVLIQMPIFLGLWQALNNSVALRHSGFLWIRNLAAPDQLFPFPTDIPFLGPYFNLLPFVVIVLMLIQTKLFSPPATTPEQQQQQSMMKWMMVVMMMMFYKVPSGLGLYFITSSLWSICERLLLPKFTRDKKPATSQSGDNDSAGPDARTPSPKPKSPPSNGNGNGKPPGWRERLRERLEKVIEDAEHNKTARNSTSPPQRSRDDANPNPQRRRRPDRRR